MNRVVVKSFSVLSRFAFNLLNIPMICNPLNFLKNDAGNSGGYLLNKKLNLSSIIKENREGSSSFRLTNRLLDTINLLQNKVYTIDTTVLTFMQYT